MYNKTVWVDGQAPSINDTNLNKIEQGIADAHEAIDNVFSGGSSEERPATPKLYHPYFDTTLGKPIWWTGTKWVDAVGVDVV